MHGYCGYMLGKDVKCEKVWEYWGDRRRRPTANQHVLATPHLQDLGNEAYKKKDFDAAIRHYNRALELYDADMTFLTNRAAVFFEQVGGEGKQRDGQCDGQCIRHRCGNWASGSLHGLGGDSWAQRSGTPVHRAGYVRVRHGYRVACKLCHACNAFCRLELLCNLPFSPTPGTPRPPRTGPLRGVHRGLRRCGGQGPRAPRRLQAGGARPDAQGQRAGQAKQVGRQCRAGMSAG